MTDQGEPDSRSLDVFGVKPLGDTVSHATKTLVNGAANFFGKICLPAAEEYGLLLRDKVANWRAQNAAKIAESAKSKMKDQQINIEGVHAHPRVMGQIIDSGSWADTQELQDLWAGLLISSCTPDGKDESNLIFANLLKEMTSLQASVLAYCCEQVRKRIEKGLVMAEELVVPIETIVSICKCEDVHRLDRELDHLRSIGVFLGGLTSSETVIATPSPLGLQLYMRCRGHRGDPISFYGLAQSDVLAVVIMSSSVTQPRVLSTECVRLSASNQWAILSVCFHWPAPLLSVRLSSRSACGA